MGDIAWFTSSKWYVQQQMVIVFHPPDHLHCNSVEYEVLETPTQFGYQMKVTYQAENDQGKPLAPWIPKTLCAKWVVPFAGKAVIAPCFLPSAWAGDYWIVAFDRQEG